MNMIITNECEKCKHGIIDDRNKAIVKVYCNARDKTYYYGQCIPCEDKEVISEKSSEV